MSLLQQQNLLAKLYTDENLRAAFFSEPEKIGKEFFLNESEITEISEMLQEEISFFSESLIFKRLREAEKILPLVRESIGDDFPRLFREFAQLYNPQTVKKHLEDALEFCVFLQKHASVSEISKNAAKYEWAKLKFFNDSPPITICFLRFDVRKINNQNALTNNSNEKRKTKIAVWLRAGNTVKHFFI